MHNRFSAVMEKTESWCIASSRGLYGQGKMVDEHRESLAQAIALLLDDCREGGLRGAAQSAIVETVAIHRPIAARNERHRRGTYRLIVSS